MLKMERRVPNGTVLMMGITYPGANKEFTYVLFKAGGLWYTSGAGRVPQAAGWAAVERWLERDNRTLNWVKVVTETAVIWPEVALPEPTEMRALIGAEPVADQGRELAAEMIRSGELRRDYSGE